MPFIGLEVKLGQSGVTIAGRGMWNGGTVEVILAIDEIVVRLTGADGSGEIRGHSLLDKLEVRLVIMVL
jgi:hypothetical protein